MEVNLMVLGTLAILGLTGNVSSTDKRAASWSCDIDPSIPCECTNPFIGTENFFLGDSVQTCNVASACYVKNLSGCSDSRQPNGGGRCQSTLACNPADVQEPGTSDQLAHYTHINCVCLQYLGNTECDECEVDCQSGCTDISRSGGKCFSKTACHTELIFG